MKTIDLSKDIKAFAKPDNHKAIRQIFNTAVTYIVLLGATFFSFNAGLLLLTAMLSCVSAFFMVRVFILFHDCTHGSFTTSKLANDRLGLIFGVLSFTPYAPWKKEHTIHHGSVGNLDRRGVGDIWTLTIDEYNSKTPFMKGIYRLFRNPFFLFSVAPFFKFLVLNRIPKKTASNEERRSVFLTNMGIVAVGIVFSLIFSFRTFAIMQFIVLTMASTIGLWLFYVQHQFEDVYWEEGENWNSKEAALKGSTFYQLPLVFEWLSGYIGYHHIHHLNSKIPNYNLKECYMTYSELKEVRTVKFLESIHLAFLQIYDAQNKQLISFKTFKKLRNHPI
jgi:acyl-lipid omega-6 desaturase (Delta-12 desaturase)